MLGTGVFGAEAAQAYSPKGENLFTLGVASGDPAPDGFVLWTRLAPDALAEDGFGGMPDKRVKVDYEVATDERFRHVVKRGSAVASRELGHSVHPEIHGLQPGREYFYRFRAGGQISPVGRTRTMPSRSSTPRSLDFVFASCQAWQDGYFTAYDHIVEDDPELLVFLGDYIYEYEILDNNKRGVDVDPKFGTECFDLARYRLQYSFYKSEAPLQRAHAAMPWIVTLDDHEVVNDWAADEVAYGRHPNPDPEEFAARKTAAFQAYYENLPLRIDQRPSGPSIQLYRRLSYGRLATFSMIDCRSYRDVQPCRKLGPAECEERYDPNRTMLGTEQREWLIDGFADDESRWHILGNQDPITETDWDATEGKNVWLDPWDGYTAERATILEAAQHPTRNLVVLTGDRHQNYACDLKQDFTKDDSPVVATEFVTTSLTSGGNGADMDDLGRTFLSANSHMKFYNNQRGYVRVNVDKHRWQSDFRVLPYVTDEGAPVSTRASYVVEDGKPGPQAD
ncbi:alkaline phosphatase D family protein [Stackebrandtia nassauensis]